jgi:Trk-type K+ transport system membrane component
LKRKIHPSRLIAVAFSAVILLGAVILSLPFVTKDGKGTGFVDALFTATSAVTVTGLGSVDTESHWNIVGHWVIAILIQIGGFGIVGFATLLGYLVEGRVSLSARLSASAETGAATSPEVRKVIFGILKMMALFEFMVFAFLFFRLLGHYGYSLPDALGHGAFHAISSFNNAGFALYSDNLMRFTTDGWILLPIAFSVLFGALGFPVLSEVWDRFRARFFPIKNAPRLAPQWSLNSRIVLWATLVLVGSGTLFLGFAEWNNPATFGPLDTASKLLNSFFAAVMPRTAGFNAVDTVAMTDASLLGTDILMFIGGGSASTAGGIKIGTAVVLLYIVYTEIRGETAVNIGNRRLPRSIQRQALTIITLTSLFVLTSTMYFRLTTDFPLDRILFEVLSAISTVGLSAGLTAASDETGKLVLAALMFTGRVGTVSIATALALRRSKRHFEYPRERPLIG